MDSEDAMQGQRKKHDIKQDMPDPKRPHSESQGTISRALVSVDPFDNSGSSPEALSEDGEPAKSLAKKDNACRITMASGLTVEVPSGMETTIARIVSKCVSNARELGLTTLK